MSKVRMFSTHYPAFHPKKGQPTYFVEKMFAGFHELNIEPYFNYNFDASVLVRCEPKYHTIREGNHFKVGDKFSPRVWELPGGMYTKGNKMITLAPDIEVKKVWEFEIKERQIFIDIYSQDLDTMDHLAENDGLLLPDFFDWFQYPKPFKGQIICWNEDINY